jgi:amino-acid N-acetyltransferase
MKTRRARPVDAAAIFALISGYAEQGLLLHRTREEISAHLPHFLVAEAGGSVVACLSLEPYGTELAEIRSLAVAPGTRGRGLGAQLLQHSLAIARRRGFARVFAVTHAPEFFLRHGFAPQSRLALTEKIERDCAACPQRRGCELRAVVAVLRPVRHSLPVLSTQAPAAP